MNPPIEGLKVRPCGENYMAGAWAGCLSYAISDKEAVAAFQEETGIDLSDSLLSSGIAGLIDESTGRRKSDMLAFIDWVTTNLWGVEGKDD